MCPTSQLISTHLSIFIEEDGTNINNGGKAFK